MKFLPVALLLSVAVALPLARGAFTRETPKVPAAPAETKAPAPEPAEQRLKALGPLAEDLDLWIAMETTAGGGVVWRRDPVKVIASSEVAIKAEGACKWMDFHEPGALLKLEPVLTLPRAYTLCTWMLFPAPHGHSVVWQGTHGGGAAVFATAQGLFGWSGKRNQQVHYGPLPPETAGWHHLAVTCDGERTAVFLDGKAFGAVEEVLETDLLAIGSHWMAAHQKWMMCDGLRQQFLFHRVLTEAEIDQVMAVEKGE